MRFRFDSRLGLILIFDLDLALIPTILLCNRAQDILTSVENASAKVDLFSQCQENNI